jgi:biotin carboxylase
VNHSLVNRVVLAAMVAAMVAPAAAQAGTTPRYDGYKSSYPQLHEVGVVAGMPDPDLKSSYPQLHDAVVAAGIPDPDLRSSYPQVHELLSGAASTQAAAVAEGSGVDWRDAGFGALVGAAAASLLAVAAVVRVRRHRLPGLH